METEFIKATIETITDLDELDNVKSLLGKRKRELSENHTATYYMMKTKIDAMTDIKEIESVQFMFDQHRHECLKKESIRMAKHDFDTQGWSFDDSAKSLPNSVHLRLQYNVDCCAWDKSGFSDFKVERMCEDDSRQPDWVNFFNLESDPNPDNEIDETDLHKLDWDGDHDDPLHAKGTKTLSLFIKRGTYENVTQYERDNGVFYIINDKGQIKVLNTREISPLQFKTDYNGWFVMDINPKSVEPNRLRTSKKL